MVHCKSSFTIVQMPNNSNGKVFIHFTALELHFREALSCLWNLYQTIGNRVVQCGLYAFRAKSLHQLLPKYRLKLSATVCSYHRWYTKSSSPATKKSLGYCLCSDIFNWDYFRPACEMINTSEDICIPIGWWQWANNVYVNVVKPDVCVAKLPKGVIVSNSVSLYFTLLAF